MAEKRIWKEVGLENTLHKVVESFKAHSKGGRVRKHTTQGMRAQRRTRNEAGLENALPMRWGLEGALKRRQG
jgi:hypothetical protein